MGSPRPELRALPLNQVPPRVHYEFCRVMDVLSDRDWTRFASRVLSDITDIRLVKEKEHRTDAVMLQWQNRNGSVGQLLDLLQSLELLQAWDIINSWASLPPPRVVLPVPAPPPSGFIPPHRAPPTEPPAAPPTLPFSPSQMPPLLPKPQPPELLSTAHSLLSSAGSLPRPLLDSAASAPAALSLCMAWAYEEVHAGTCGFRADLKVGEGGFGEVYRAILRNTDCAVKRFKQDSSLDWSLLRDSFQTEVEKLSKFRHPNIVDLLGYSEGGGTYCLIYSFMENRSLDDQLRHDAPGLSWSQRLSVAKGAAKALQFLHCPPEGQTPLVHGDVKSSNILLDRHLEAKLADFGLARFCPRAPPGRTAAQTCSFVKSPEVRGTEAYLPNEYLRGSCRLGPFIDVYSFGVVLLEILTGRRALDTRTGRDVYLKDLVAEVEESEAEWRKHLDQRLVSGGAAEPSGFMQVVALARRCLDKVKKRPSMTEVFRSLDQLPASRPPPSSPLSLPSRLDSSACSRPAPPRSLDSGLSALSLNPKTPQPPRASSLTPPQTLHSSMAGLAPSALAPPAPSWLSGPCETDESRGYSQYDLRSNGVSPAGPCRCEAQQPSVPTEDQFNFTGASAAESLQSYFPVVLNSSKQHLLKKKELYDQGMIHSLQLLSIDDPNSGRSPAESRLPEESDELDFI